MNKSLKSILLQMAFLILLVVSSSNSIFAKDSLNQQAEVLVQSYMDSHCVAGLAVSVAYGNEIIWSKGFGYSDLESQTKVSTETSLFRIASISKPITAFALNKLVQAKELQLDVPITNYVTDFPKKKYPFSLRQLAGHIAGIRSYKGNEFLSNKQYKDIREGLDIFKNDPLQSKPGTQYLYSSYGWNLISVVMDVVTENGYLDFIKKEVFSALDMPHTVAESNQNIILGRGGYYQCQNGMLKNAPQVNNSYKLAGGGFLSSSNDIVRFGMAHLNKKLLNPEQRKLLWTSQNTANGKPTHYGLGWVILESLNKGDDRWRQIYHNGGSTGASAYLSIYPEKGLVISVLTNTSHVDFSVLRDSFANIWLKGLK